MDHGEDLSGSVKGLAGNSWLTPTIRPIIGSTMPDLQFEREQLVLADRHVAEGEARLAKQRRLVEQMAEKGQDTAQAERMFRDFGAVLEQFYIHRQLILDAIARGGTAPQHVVSGNLLAVPCTSERDGPAAEPPLATGPGYGWRGLPSIAQPSLTHHRSPAWARRE